MDAFTGSEPDVPPQLAEKLLHTGYIKIDAEILFSTGLPRRLVGEVSGNPPSPRTCVDPKRSSRRTSSAAPGTPGLKAWLAASPRTRATGNICATEEAVGRLEQHPEAVAEKNRPAIPPDGVRAFP